jgi:hypothetical protein
MRMAEPGNKENCWRESLGEGLISGLLELLNHGFGIRSKEMN